LQPAAADCRGRARQSARLILPLLPPWIAATECRRIATCDAAFETIGRVRRAAGLELRALVEMTSGHVALRGRFGRQNSLDNVL
jgi:hypothetical protein